MTLIVNVLILFSISLILVAGFLEMTGRRRLYKISKASFWMFGIYAAVIAVFFQGQGTGSVMNLQR
jgi:hypothetical protein